MSGSYLHLLHFRMVVHEQIFLPFGTRLGVVAEQYVIETETQKLLRRQQRHTCLFGRTITFSLITFHTGRDKVGRCAFSALGTGKNVIECEVLCVSVIAAVLAAITITNINASTLHGCLAAVAANMNIVPQSNHGRDGENRRG